jgi:4-hydroxy-4-methyl-2-oxoglutarate aldolase
MIDDPPLLVVRKSFPRPSAAEVDAFRGVPTAFICDAMNGFGAMDYRIKALPGVPSSFCGVALPCDCGAQDNLALAGAIGIAAAGDVILAATAYFTTTSVVGDLMVGMMKNRGVAGFVTDGVMRDLADLQRIGLPCYALGLNPNSPVKSGPGTVGLPVVVGGVPVDAGDIVVGDLDGVVVVPQARIADTIKGVAAVKAAEAAMLAKVKGGLREPGYIAALLASDKVRHV